MDYLNFAWLMADISDLSEELVIISLLTTALIIIVVALRWGKNKLKANKHINNSDISYFKKILFFQIILTVIVSLVWLPSELKSIILAPFYLAISTLPFFIFHRILRRKYININKASLLTLETEDDLNENIKTLLDSNNFLTALRSTLPRGEKDSEYGLDYIPYMLKNVDERRARFSKRAKGFLITSIIAGTVFVIITLWLGYILLNEDSISTGKVLRDLKSQTTELNRTVSFISPKTYAHIEEYKNIKDQIRSINNSLSIYEDSNFKTNISVILSEFLTTEDITSLHNNVNNIDIPYNSENEDDIKLRREFNTLKFQIIDFMRIKESAFRQVPELVDRIDDIIKTSKQELSKTTNRTPDIIKRLILSFVILSFFLTILRFLANQYRHNFEQLIKAEEDDLNIRKTYIALKTAGDDIESKQIVLNQLLSKFDSTQDNNKKEPTENTLLVKSLIETLAKKVK